MRAIHCRRPAFTLMELMAVLTILCILLAFLIPAMSHSRKGARHSQCHSNLRQIGLGIQNFHDIRTEICPAYLTNDDNPRAEPRDYATWTLLILPFVEQTDLWELIDLCEPLSSDLVGPLVPMPGRYGGTNGPVIRHEPDHPTLRKTPIFAYFCPSRRQPRLTVNSVASTGDYACVSRADLMPLDPAAPRTWDAAMLPSRDFNATQQLKTSSVDGVQLGPGDYRSMTTFADVTDGLSNTIFIGEKAVRVGSMGGHPTNFARTVDSDQQDGPFYYGGLGVKNNLADLRAPGAIAYWSRRLAPHGTSPTLPANPRTDPPENRFGSWHPGVTLFLLGDGSVKTVAHGTSNRVLQQLGCRNDQSATTEQ